MFVIKPEHARRAALATKLFPKLNSSVSGLTLDANRNQRSKNRDLLLHLGFLAEPNGSSTFLQLPLYRRSIRKLTKLVEYELEKVGAQEVLMPTLIPQNYWIKSKRLERQADALRYVYKLRDNNDRDLLLGPTYEESLTELVGNCLNASDSDLPLLLYQTSPKFRFEPNPRFGLIRSNEFLMNDMYSFDANLERATETYNQISKVYQLIFNRLGLECLQIESITGNIGGDLSHEYQTFVSSGEDNIIRCNNCGYACNSELQVKLNPELNVCTKCSSKDLNKLQALELGHTFLLGDTYSKPLDARFLNQRLNKREFYQMGCYGLGLSRILGAGVDKLSVIPNDDNNVKFIQIRWPNEVEPYKYGLVPPAKRSKQTHAGSSEFIQQFLTEVLDSTSATDILVEDQIKEGIGWRIMRLQALGIPNIIIIGQRFLQDPPEIELLKLNRESKTYDQFWYTKDQLVDYIRKSDNKAS